MMDNNDDNDANANIHNDPEFLRWCRRQRNVDDVDYDIRVRRRADDEELRKIETNDPTFTTMTIDYYGEDDWEELGTAIGRNTHLEEVILNSGMSYIPAIYFREFTRGLAFNRSIRTFCITSYENSPRFPEAWEHLTRFFIDNEALECLELNLRWSVGGYDELVTALQSFASLKEFKLSIDQPRNDDARVDNVIHALIGHHTGLRKLTIAGFQLVGRGCAALCAALATSSLSELHLQFDALNFNGPGAFFGHINDTGARVFANCLARNTALKVLEIKSARHICEITWQSIFTAFSTCRIESLILHSSELNDATMQPLTNALRRNTTLKNLSLRDNWRVTDTGWASLLTALRRPNSVLEKLDMSDNCIGDIGINALTNALLDNSILKELSVDDAETDGNHYVTSTGWMNFSSVLRNPTSALEVLTVWSGSINDEVMHSFADALANNNKLRELNVGKEYTDITPDGYAAMTNLLCNKSSILNTFNSNHTLEMRSHESDEHESDRFNDKWLWPNDISSLLKINRENSVSQAARLKIINSHFSGSEINMQPFMEMNLNVRPYAIAWMAKDERVYELLRAMPSLLDQFEDDVIRSKKRTSNI